MSGALYGSYNYICCICKYTTNTVNGKPHTWSKKVPPFQAASINYSNVFNLQYSGIFSDHGSKSSM